MSYAIYSSVHFYNERKFIEDLLYAWGSPK